MPAYGQYCPVARALEVIGDRWSLLIIRELLTGSHRFNQIERGLPGISRSLLVQRLDLLQRGGVVERHRDAAGRTRAYVLTPAGLELRPLVLALRDWGGRWAFDDPRPEELDPGWLVSSMLQRRRPEALPPRRTVVEFQLRRCQYSHVWLLLDPRADGDVCLKHPGFDSDLVVVAEGEVLFRVWLGRLPLAEAERRGLMKIEGAPALRRAFPDWFDWPDVPPAASGHANRRPKVERTTRLRRAIVGRRT
jgi:DNA-binding HxlR family transcriptional regulator